MIQHNGVDGIQITSISIMSTPVHYVSMPRKRQRYAATAAHKMNGERQCNAYSVYNNALRK